MFQLVKFRGAVAALCLGLGITTTSWAEDPPKVRIVPDAREAEKREVLLDGPLPAGTAFDIEVPAADLKFTGARIEVWPSRDQACTNADKGDRQHYRYAMTAYGTGADRVLRARIPPLQIGQGFCVEVFWIAKLDANDLPAFKNEVAGGFVARLGSKRGDGITKEEIREALSE